MPVDRDAVARALAEANARTGLFRTGAVPVETVRERGFYWVRFDDFPPEVAEWDPSAWGGCWWRAGKSGAAMPSRVAVLSPRLTPPEPGTAAPEPGTAAPRAVGVPGGDAPDADRPPKSPPDGVPPQRGVIG